MIVILILLIPSFASALIDPYGTIVEDMKCICGIGYNSSLSAYFPVFESKDISDYTDMRGNKLHTLQEFLDGRSPFVTAAMDRALNLPYGTQICIPELNKHYRRRIQIEVRDTDADLDGFGRSRVDICVRSEADSYDNAVNQPISLIIEE